MILSIRCNILSFFYVISGDSRGYKINSPIAPMKIKYTGLCDFLRANCGAQKRKINFNGQTQIYPFFFSLQEMSADRAGI